MNREPLTELIEFLQSITGQPELSDNSDLLELGLLDSLTMMDLLVFVETEFSLRLDFKDINPQQFQTPAEISRMITERSDEGHSADAA